MTKRFLLALALSLFAITGCNLVYKQNIQQGNAIEQEDLDKLRLGMTKNQVSFLLGTPAVRDPFHRDRWDYVSTFSRRGDEAVMRKVTLYFENGTLSEMIGVDADEFIFEEDEPLADEDTAPDIASETEAETFTEADEESPAEVSALETPAAEQAPYEETAAESTSPAVQAAAAEDIAQDAAQAAEPVVDVIETPVSEPAITAPEAPEAAPGWAIQLGAFDSQENARTILQRLQDAGFDAEIITQETSSSGTRYLVRQQGIDSKAAAEQLIADIMSGLGINGFVVPPTN
ncbi:MAG: outer membrane protein assembly factor BamE domain-containing protein [Lysobacterales bacterium]